MKTILVGFALVLAACGGHNIGGIDNTIGASCVTDRNCADRCYIDNGDNFPGGFCSMPCLSDNDCPSDTVCVTHAGGVCMYACPPFDCTRLGPGWGCHDADRIGGGKTTVCSG